MSSLPPLQTPLYNHPLPALEQWLSDLGACRDRAEPAIWDLMQPSWSARIELEVEELKVSWEQDGSVTVRLFPYGLSRADVESAILAGP
ncbi:DUF3143 domain-containing protein [Synechococcus sp. CS-1329]|uniref:DUF3143 domain-containing protein n=1 Tax=Synechococcus sp. CS-1329 TaxID=2847975 RepID=UPI00223BFFA8|nr:DUF3143 domain-containing protein [Synechococcus sp. CS-1329]MCT0217932.1 DUF3143 domain-containing protein [Synechococcus sp. CS-1329]